MSVEKEHIMTVFDGLQFTDEEISLLKQKLEIEHYKKGSLIIKSGDLVPHMYFIISGCLRTFYIDDHGKEHTFQFAIKDLWITDFTAFFKAKKALMNLEVIQNATVVKLTHKNRLHLINSIPQIHTYTREKLENAYSDLQLRTLSNLSLSAKKRYLYFIEMHPNFEKEVKNYHIASYLGITTESLSRIRKEISKSSVY
ncbi:Crp/Fnr family transcriptional regulator [Psychroserpens sp. Hel_I_66]|uniref:Crp/Fnr family transcriptional regulator n=1 Tax=Psychroserpens sp. Hel_I_66 TaxID=1250004 RepID=UPI0006487AA3|nr:Crp/Fnr family transcriptional regulator [Psychroserpens sp. Hel_I_66]